MAKVKVKVIGSGAPGDPIRVDLPTYSMISGTEVYAAGVLKSVEVLVPDDEVDDKGRPDKAKIRHKYRGQPKWDHADVLKDVVAE